MQFCLRVGQGRACWLKSHHFTTHAYFGFGSPCHLKRRAGSVVILRSSTVSRRPNQCNGPFHITAATSSFPVSKSISVSMLAKITIQSFLLLAALDNLGSILAAPSAIQLIDASPGYPVYQDSTPYCTLVVGQGWLHPLRGDARCLGVHLGRFCAMGA